MGADRIALLGPAPPDRGGIARETALLAEELSTRVEVSYFTFSRPYPRWLDPRRFDAAPAAVGSVLPARSLLDYRSPRSWRETADEIAAAGADVVLAPWWTSFWGLPLRAVFRRLRKRSPRTLRALLCHNVDDHESGWLQRFLALGAFSSSDAFVVHAEADRRRLERRVPGRPVAVLPHPVVGAPQPDRETARRELEITTPLVLFLGLVRRYKGVDVLLDAAPAIVGETGARIAVVGEVFPDARDLEERRRRSPVRDAVLWRDEYVSEEEMARWLAACDVVVLPYRYVSGSGIAARAIAARRPICAAAVGGLAETVEPGVTGELFPPGNSGALAEAVERALDRGFSAYAPGLERAAEEASWPRYVESLLAFLGSVSPRAEVRELRASAR
ncbi:MAG TPA: glycosyltransferase [Thermoanaerobaculia bacterium]